MRQEKVRSRYWREASLLTSEKTKWYSEHVESEFLNWIVYYYGRTQMRSFVMKAVLTVMSILSIPLLPLETLQIVKKCGSIRILMMFSVSIMKLWIHWTNFVRRKWSSFAFNSDTPVFPDRNSEMMQDYLRRLYSIISLSSETLQELKLNSLSMHTSIRSNLFPVVLIARYLLTLPLTQIFSGIIVVTFAYY